MKLRVEFDADDFQSMIEDFFNEAGFSISTDELELLQAKFKKAFPDNIAITVMPGGKSEISRTESSPPLSPPSVEEPSPAVEDDDAVEPVLSAAQLLDPRYSEDQGIKNILSISKKLERGNQ